VSHADLDRSRLEPPECAVRSGRVFISGSLGIPNAPRRPSDSPLAEPFFFRRPSVWTGDIEDSFGDPFGDIEDTCEPSGERGWQGDHFDALAGAYGD
jgi:hypothetical protein